MACSNRTVDRSPRCPMESLPQRSVCFAFGLAPPRSLRSVRLLHRGDLNLDLHPWIE